jgi:ribosomal-protein-alanine N-acetyltransferase
MARGLRLVLAQAFGTLGLHRVEANIQPHNARSIALVRRLGFRLEGYSPQYLQIQGAWADHERWALRADEFEAAAGSSRA